MFSVEGRSCIVIRPYCHFESPFVILHVHSILDWMVSNRKKNIENIIVMRTVEKLVTKNGI